MNRLSRSLKMGVFVAVAILMIGTASVLYANANEGVLSLPNGMESIENTEAPIETDEVVTEFLENELPGVELPEAEDLGEELKGAKIIAANPYLESLQEFREAKALSDENRTKLYEQGYSLQDIRKAEELSAYTDLTVADILLAKGKEPNQTIKVEKHEDGTEFSRVTDFTIDNWNKALDTLKLDLFGVVDKIGIAPEAVALAREKELTEYEVYELAALSSGFGNSFEETLRQYLNGRTLQELEIAYANVMFGKSNQHRVSEQASTAQIEANLRQSLKLTTEEEKFFQQNNISSIKDIANIKHLAAEYQVNLDRVLNVHKEVGNWERVPAMLEVEKNEK